MKKVSTGAAKQSRNFSQQKLTIGLDLGDRSSYYCVLDETGTMVLEHKVATTPQSSSGSVCGHTAQPGSAGDGHALALAHVPRLRETAGR
jgi:hypothetical protein